MYKVGCDVDVEEVPSLHCLGNGSVVACAISREIWFHVLRSSSFRLVSQFTCCCHRVWRNNLAEIFTGEISLRGSKIADVHFNMSRLVVIVVRAEVLGLLDE